MQTLRQATCDKAYLDTHDGHPIHSPVLHVELHCSPPDYSPEGKDRNHLFSSECPKDEWKDSLKNRLKRYFTDLASAAEQRFQNDTADDPFITDYRVPIKMPLNFFDHFDDGMAQQVKGLMEDAITEWSRGGRDS